MMRRGTKEVIFRLAVAFVLSAVPPVIAAHTGVTTLTGALALLAFS